MKQEIYDSMMEAPIIAAVKDSEGLEICCKNSEIQIVFILYGDICEIGPIIKKVKNVGKVAMVHIDLINGFSSKEISVDFIKENTEVDGIISTKPSILKRGNELGLCTILRLFVLDSLAFKNIHKQLAVGQPDCIELLPGLMPKIISKVCKASKIPIIAGGLITEKEDVVAALSSGAIAVSTSNRRVWEM